MTNAVTSRLKPFALIAVGLAIGAMGLYVAQADDAPGAGGLGMILMAAAVVLGVKSARNRIPAWASRIALVVGILIAAFAALLTHGVAVAGSLFPGPDQVPSTAAPAPPAQYAEAAARARDQIRSIIQEQNLPGVSVAVAAGGSLVWAEGFGWRDVATRTPVTPDTRFNIGTAASAVAPVVDSLHLTHTGTDEAGVWSPEHVGEPEEDFPPLALLRHVIWEPIGLMPLEPLPGDRATFYVPRTDDNPRRGRRLMAMRALGCCVNGLAFSSTPSDLVRVALATRPGNVDGELAGGLVASLLTRPDGVVVAVTSNIAHAKTAALAAGIADAFAARAR